MPSVGSSLATVPAAAAACFVPDLRWVLIACCKSRFPSWVVSQLFTKSAPLESGCLEERIEILAETETTVEEVTEVTVDRVAWTWRRFIWELVGREDAPPEISFVMLLVFCCRRQRPKEERSPTHVIRQRENSSPEGVWW